MRFVDTNIPVYAVSTMPEDAPKQRAAEQLLSRPDLAFSIQVFGEFYVQVTRPSRPGALLHGEALEVIDLLQQHYVQPLTMDTFSAAIRYREMFNLSYWDCMVLAAAKLSGCEVIYSEDFSHNQDYDGIQVINPFLNLAEHTIT